jgi:Uma2 family endonuclease
MPQTAQQFYQAFAQGREPASDEPEMESSLHYDQLALLVSTLEWHWRERDDFFMSADAETLLQCSERILTADSLDALLH